MAGSRRESAASQRSETRRARLLLTLLLAPLGLLTLVGLVALWPHHVVLGQPILAPGQHIYDGHVVAVQAQSCQGPDYDPSSIGPGSKCGTATVFIDDGPDKGTSWKVDLLPETFMAHLPQGAKLRLLRTPASPGFPLAYSYYDVKRGNQLLLIAAAFAVVVVGVARLRGLRALVGLAFAFAVLAKFILPALLDGRSGALVGAVGASLIMFVVLYVAHGFSLRTSAALTGTLFGLAITATLGTIAIHWTHLTGGGTIDDNSIATLGGQVDLTGLLLCGVIIAGLGVLNDVTITQTSAVWELYALAPDTPRSHLFGAAMRIGRDHIASTVYTIVFAYAGTALPIFLLSEIYRLPLFDLVTGEQVAEEVVRTLVAAIGLVLAVPATTFVAVLTAGGGAGTSAIDGDTHRHHIPQEYGLAGQQES